MLRGIQPIWHRLKPGSTGILGLPRAAVDLTSNTYEVIGFVRHSEEKAKAQATNLRPDTKALSAAIVSSGFWFGKRHARWGGRNSKWNWCWLKHHFCHTLPAPSAMHLQASAQRSGGPCVPCAGPGGRTQHVPSTPKRFYIWQLRLRFHNSFVKSWSKLLQHNRLQAQ